VNRVAGAHCVAEEGLLGIAEECLGLLMSFSETLPLIVTPQKM